MIRMGRPIVQYVLALGLALLLTVAAVQVADPFSSPTSPTHVDLADPPADIAADSLRILHVVNHTQTVTAKSVVEADHPTAGGTESNVRVGLRREFHVAPENNSYLVSQTYNRSIPSNPKMAEYGRENTGWRWWWVDDSWYEVGNLRYPIQRSFDPTAIKPGAVRVVDENASTLVLLVHDPTVARAGARGTVTENSDPGQLYLHVDKQSRRLSKAIYVDKETYPPIIESRTVFDFSDYGRTRAPRPEGVPRYTLKDTLRDFSNGPLFRTWRLFPAL